VAHDGVMYSFGFRKASGDDCRLILGEMNLGLDSKDTFEILHQHISKECRAQDYRLCKMGLLRRHKMGAISAHHREAAISSHIQRGSFRLKPNVEFKIDLFSIQYNVHNIFCHNLERCAPPHSFFLLPPHPTLLVLLLPFVDCLRVAAELR